MSEYTSANSTRTLRVYLLRHGEREDEVPGRQPTNEMPIDRQLDPRLTMRGHQQAAEAWQRIIPSLSSIRVMVASSPMLRTLGTALMVASSEIVANCTQIKWVPSPLGTTSSNTTQHDEGTTTAPAIPIAVVNGLCDCALAVEQKGGSKRLLPYLRCAVKEDSRLLEHVSHMQDRLEASGGTTAGPLLKQAIRFGALLDSGDASSVSIGCNTNITDPRPDGSFASALQRVTRAAIRVNADVLIVVTHREGIRDWINKCMRTTQRHSTPYCCIASFSVSMEHADESLRWKFHCLEPYERFSPIRDV